MTPGSNSVLTSARCLIENALQTHVVAGSTSVELKLPFEPSDDSLGLIRKVTKMKLHELFRPELLDYDVAIAFFDDELAFGGMLHS